MPDGPWSQYAGSSDGGPWTKYAKSSEQKKPEGPPTMVGSFFRSMLEGAKETGLGAAQFGVDLLTPGYMPGRQAAIQGLGNMAAQARQAYQGSPDVRTNPMTSAAGRFAGQVLPTMVPGLGMGRTATMAARVGQGALGGAVGAAAAPVEAGDYWKQKEKDLGLGTAMGA